MKTCRTFRLAAQVDMQDTLRGELIFTYNADGRLQQVSGLNQVENNFFMMHPDS